MSTTRNEFGVESSNSGGFGAGVGSDFEDMFEEATAASVVDDEVSDTRRSRRATPAEPDYFNQPQAPQSPVPLEETSYETELSYEPDSTVQPEPSFDEAPAGFGQTDDLDSMFEQAESVSVADDEVSEPVHQVPAVEESFGSFNSFGADAADSFESFGTDPEFEEAQSFQQEPEQSFEAANWNEPAAVEPEPVSEPEVEPESEPDPVYYAPTVADPTPSVVPAGSAPAPSAPPAAEGSVDYIERVILTSDAIRELGDADAKAVNMFITAGQPVESHQELVLTSLLADRQIYKTAEAILAAKEKTSVDRAFYILGLDDATFVDFGKILSHDLESTETVIFEGDRLQYARKLVDVVESLPAVSIKRFEAVKSVLGAGELDS